MHRRTVAGRSPWRIIQFALWLGLQSELRAVHTYAACCCAALVNAFRVLTSAALQHITAALV